MVPEPIDWDDVLVDAESVGLVPHSNQALVARPLGVTLPFRVAVSIPRREAAKMAADAGCTVTENVVKSTTLLVVGDQDVRRLAGHEKSSKHRKTEELIIKGQPIRILGESDFTRLIGLEAGSGVSPGQLTTS